MFLAISWNIFIITKLLFRMNRIIRHVTFTQIRLGSTRPPINPKGRFDDRNEADLEAVKKLPESQKGKLFMEEAPIPKWPGGVNPNTGEKGGPGIDFTQTKFKSSKSLESMGRNFSY